MEPLVRVVKKLSQVSIKQRQTLVLFLIIAVTLVLLLGQEIARRHWTQMQETGELLQSRVKSLQRAYQNAGLSLPQTASSVKAIDSLFQRSVRSLSIRGLSLKYTSSNRNWVLDIKAVPGRNLLGLLDLLSRQALLVHSLKVTSGSSGKVTGSAILTLATTDKAGA